MIHDRPICIVDTTLRDGEQAPGVVFSLDEKLDIATALDRIGVDEIEAGIPAMGKDACREITALSRLNLSCILSCWCRAKKEDIRLAALCNTPGVHISFPTSSILLKTFDMSEEWVMQELETLVLYAKQYFDRVSVGAQDATRTRQVFLNRFARHAFDAGADRLRLADTVGMISPSGVMKTIASLVENVPGLDLEFHGHNDLGMATANAVSAVDAGASALSVTVNGLGERAGNAPLEEVIMALFEVGGYAKKIDFSFLLDLCRLVAAASKRPIHSSKPIVGSDIFRHESGIHASGLLKEQSSYQLFDPQKLGDQKCEYVIGVHSGAAAVCHILAENNITAEKAKVSCLLPEIRKAAKQKKSDLTPQEVIKLYASSLN